MENQNPYQRRLTDKLLICINIACDLGDIDNAKELLTVLENLIGKPKYDIKERRKIAISTVEVSERIWMLRHKISQQNSDNFSG